MRKQEKAAAIGKILAEFYPETPIPLNHEDAYTLLISVLLSAQCTDERVNKITPLLWARAKAPQEMVGLSIGEIEHIIRPCGLSPAKSKAIHRLSELLLERHQGEVPNDIAALEALPGVGHKTASVVMSQAFGVPAFPVDTHIHRLAWRWGLSNGKNVVQTERDLTSLYPPETWNKLHLRMIFFGREYCPAKGHNPYECPICKAYGRKSEFKLYDEGQKKKVKQSSKRVAQ